MARTRSRRGRFGTRLCGLQRWWWQQRSRHLDNIVAARRGTDNHDNHDHCRNSPVADRRNRHGSRA